ncbi:MAG: FG-GAP-like repeat-containing protein [Planctomycetota bacterium]
MISRFKMRLLVGGLSFLAVAGAFDARAQQQREAGTASDAWRLADPFVRAINQGVALMEMYEYGPAVGSFEEALKLQPSSLEARLNLANALFNRSAQNDIDRAAQLLEEVLAKEPENPRALYFRAIVFQQLGKANESLPYLERLVKIVPHDGFAWYLLGRSLSQAGQSPRAALERAVQENPAFMSAYYELMKITMREGDRAKAMEYKRIFDELNNSPLPDKLQLPQYREMGPLALVRPFSQVAAHALAVNELRFGEPKVLLASSAAGAPGRSVPFAMADVNNDSHIDVVTASDPVGGTLALLIATPEGSFTEKTKGSGLSAITLAQSVAFGDYDDDENVDLYVCRQGPNVLLRGKGDGTFEDVTAATGTAGPDVLSTSALFVDADHDADLDIYVCQHSDSSGSPVANQLFNNNADGTFVDIAIEVRKEGEQDVAVPRPIACATDKSLAVAPSDLDGDRDIDLVVFNAGGPARFFLNERLGRFSQVELAKEPMRAEAGGVVQDFDGDERPDLLVFPCGKQAGRLYLASGFRALERSTQFDDVAKALATHGEARASRVADVDLDGDLDVAVFGEGGHLLLNDGRGRFVLRPNAYPAPPPTLLACELADLTRDGVLDLVRLCGPGPARLEIVPVTIEPPSNWLALRVTGSRGREKNKRSPVSGYGTRIEVRAGTHGQVITCTGLSGGLGQSQIPLIVGLNGATQADYVALTWPDGVTQAESGLVAMTLHRIEETERRISSCPVLFSWNGERFLFVGDFAGVGGLGYFAAPGEYSYPQKRELVRIAADQLEERDGRYELRVCEPMEEVAYVDRLELQAVDHPDSIDVYPDERLAVTGPPPSQRLLGVRERVYPERALGPNGEDCLERLRDVDRQYAYIPQTDRRFFGFCAPHTLVLEFGDRLSGIEAAQPVFLFVNGSIEYPYSQTIFAAGQAQIAWEPMRVELLEPDGSWTTIIPDAGTPGGMGRMIAIELTGKLPDGPCTLRVTTNLEIYYDALFVAVDACAVGAATAEAGRGGLLVHTVPMLGAELRRLGFPLEYSPDGQHPRIYTYDIIERTSSLKTPQGSYTRYGCVRALLAEFDDLYVVCGTGDEIAVSFDARALPRLPEGWVRDFVLVSNTYCKDMDLYTATPDTVEPLPFQAMSRYPYPLGELYPQTEATRRYQEAFNTREVR